MKITQRCIWIVIIVSLFMMPMFHLPVIKAQESPRQERTLFSADFEDGVIPPEIGVSPNWTIESTTIEDVGDRMVLQNAVGVGEEQLVLLPSPAWENYRVDMRLQIAGTGKFAVNARRDVENVECLTGFLLEVSVLENTNRLGAAREGCDIEWLDQGTDVHIPLAEWIDLRMDVVESGVFVYLGDELILSGQSDIADQGGFSLSILDDMRVAIDSISVTTIGYAEEFLENYDGLPDDIVLELREKGRLPEELGRRILIEPYVYYTGIGTGFIPLAFRRTITNSVMGGEITFSPRGGEDGIEACALTSRVTVIQGVGISGLARVAFLNDGTMQVLDQAPDTEAIGRPIPIQIDLTQPHKVVVATLDNKITAYVDGELVLSGFEVAERRGFFGLLYFGRHTSSLCEMRNWWIYEFDEP